MNHSIYLILQGRIVYIVQLVNLTISRPAYIILLLGIRENVTWERMKIGRSSANLVLIPASA